MNKKKQWPKDARLVHIDGTLCSIECMKNSDYHKDIDETKFNQVIQHKKLTGATGVTSASQQLEKTSKKKDQTKDIKINTTTSTSTLDVLTNKELTAATSNTEVPKSGKFDKHYDVNKSMEHDNQMELPDILLSSAKVDELPGATAPLTETDLAEPIHLDNINLPSDSLPLLEPTNTLDDYEALMNLDNDFDNTDLMPIGGIPAVDVVKEMNAEIGINEDLEIAMENAWILDENLPANVATDSSAKDKNRNKNKCEKPALATKTPVSPRGHFSTKTHGIRKLTPEEKKEKRFKCEECKFSRRSISEHYADVHGSCECEYCERTFANLHALKRHQYDHSSEKQYQCKDCGQEFYFNSELSAHRIKHRENPSFPCMSKGYGKIFYRNSDLNAHVLVHSGILHRCDHPNCTYSNYDKRLLTGHKHVHSDKKNFKCKYEGCYEEFKHTNARLRHYKNVHE